MKKLFSILMILTATLLLYACVKKISVKVENKELTYKLGTTLDKIEQPKKELETLDHWLVNGEKASNDYILKQGDNITAVWRAKKFFTVKFDNILEPIEEQVIREDMLVSKPTNPIKKYYVFTGWKLDGQEFDFTKHISSDITLTASWHSIGAPMKKVYISVDGVKKEAQGYYVEDLPIPKGLMKNGWFRGWWFGGKWFCDDADILNNLTPLEDGKTYYATNYNWVSFRYEIYDKKILDDPKVDYTNQKTYENYFIGHYPNINFPTYYEIKQHHINDLLNLEYLKYIEPIQGYKIIAIRAFDKQTLVKKHTIKDGIFISLVNKDVKDIAVLMIKN